MLNNFFQKSIERSFVECAKISSDVSNAIIDNTKLRGVKEYQHCTLIYSWKEEYKFDR